MQKHVKSMEDQMVLLVGCGCSEKGVPAIQGLLAKDLLILNQGQVTTSELEGPSPNLLTTPKGERLNLDIFDGGESAVLGSNSGYAGHKSVTLTARLPRPTKG
ncbi:hypothetical protein TNCV_3389381 [Trichonephila clavipes]|nr:hypothetical protein TNCV_3389381 [Trichonephila clavipes]